MADFTSKINPDGYVVMSSADRYHGAEGNDLSNERMNKFLSTGHYMMNQSTKSSVMSSSTKQSNRLPIWLMSIIYKLIGIKTYKGEKPVLATFFYTLTLLAAATYFVSYSWYTVYNIISKETDIDIISGSVEIVMVLFSCIFGCYSHDLSFKLMKNRALVNDMRQHSKALYKINLTYLSVLLYLALSGLSVAKSLDMVTDGPCKKVLVHHLVCHTAFSSKLVFYIGNFLWVTLVLIINMSVCRTHTIAVRRFIKDLKRESVISEKSAVSAIALQKSTYLHIEYDYQNENGDTEESESDSDNALPSKLRRGRSVHFDSSVGPFDSDQTPQNDQDTMTPIEPTNGPFIIEENYYASERKKDERITSNEILHEHWKFACRFRVISGAFQRWLATFVALILLSTVRYVVRWEHEKPQVIEIFHFAIPLLLFPIICSSFAEINAEGARLSGTIYPTEERMKVIEFIISNPLRVTVFGFSISYGNICAAIFAVVLAITTRMLAH